MLLVVGIGMFIMVCLFGFCLGARGRANPSM